MVPIKKLSPFINVQSTPKGDFRTQVVGFVVLLNLIVKNTKFREVIAGPFGGGGPDILHSLLVLPYYEVLTFMGFIWGYSRLPSLLSGVVIPSVRAQEA